MVPIDMSGKVFGKWTVIERDVHKKHPSLYWVCRCECGRLKSVDGAVLRCGKSTCCRTCSNTKHGSRDSPVYRVWASMVSRCHCKTDKSYSRYGARGISVCDRWRESFANFAADMGPRPDGHSIDRINNGGNYEPGNCRWATSIEQARNTRVTKRLTANGLSLTLREWSERTGIRLCTLVRRHYVAKLPDDEVINRPVVRRSQKGT